MTFKIVFGKMRERKPCTKTSLKNSEGKIIISLSLYIYMEKQLKMLKGPKEG